MAKAGDEIGNPRTAQRMVFLKTGTETGGELVQIDTYNPPTGVPEPKHVHPFQESGAQVISGLRISAPQRQRGGALRRVGGVDNNLGQYASPLLERR